MTLDTSFVVALLFRDPTAEGCERILREIRGRGEELVMSTVKLTECLILFGSRRASDAAELEVQLMGMNVGFVRPASPPRRGSGTRA